MESGVINLSQNLHASYSFLTGIW